MMGQFLHEVEIGWRMGLGDYQFTDENMMAFKRQFTPVPFHMSPELAEDSIYGRPVAAGLHTSCGWMIRFVTTLKQERARLAATGKTLPQDGPSPGVENLRWPHPVHAGDVVSYSFAVTEKRELKSRPAWGLVTGRSAGVNQNGVLVMSFTSKVLVARVT
jgi:acyl dehydratase